MFLLKMLVLMTMASASPLAHADEIVKAPIKDTVAPLIEKHPQLVLEFIRPTCPYCKYLMPIFEQLKNDYKGHPITFIRLDVTNMDEALFRKYKFDTVPTVIYFKDGKEQLRHGSNNKTLTLDDFKKNMKKVFGV